MRSFSMLMVVFMVTALTAVAPPHTPVEPIPPLTDPTLILPDAAEFPADDAPILWVRDVGIPAKVAARRLAQADNVSRFASG